jgi:hypothetical protein
MRFSVADVLLDRSRLSKNVKVFCPRCFGAGSRGKAGTSSSLFPFDVHRRVVGSFLLSQIRCYSPYHTGIILQSTPPHLDGVDEAKTAPGFMEKGKARLALKIILV